MIVSDTKYIVEDVMLFFFIKEGKYFLHEFFILLLKCFVLIDYKEKKPYMY